MLVKSPQEVDLKLLIYDRRVENNTDSKGTGCFV